MAVGDVSRLSVVGRFQQQNVVNTFHYKHVVQVANEDEVLQELIDAWEVSIKAAWLARHSDAYALIGIKAFRQAGEPKVPAFSRIETYGDVVGEVYSAFVSRVITLYTDSSYHRRRGRVQLSGGDAAHFNQTDGAVTVAEVALMQTLANLLEALLTGDDDNFQLCIPATPQLPLEDIVAARARNTPGIIRSRRIKGYFIG